MTHLPRNPSDSVATKSDIARIETCFDRMDDRMDQMQRTFLTVSFGTMTVMTAIFAFVTRI